jgi:predicted XRE-type DNA-binding protein
MNNGYQKFRIMKKYKLFIKQKGLKISWIAEQLNISQPSLSMYLNGKREMPYEIEQRLKAILL